MVPNMVTDSRVTVGVHATSALTQPKFITRAVVISAGENRLTGLQLQQTQDRRGDIIVTYVWRNGPLGKAGVRIGDIVVEVNGKKPESVGDVQRHLKESGDVVLQVASLYR
eukprot:comp11916_c0_seq1/m.6570 comp11916_c0_seq1/g.6570  ORF comp11916_c0_seq1/g.6570 comp11916_c0_seq1/m.6570 type:complete len:111 (-) comp11916_c0_seq1:410-742(-)